MWGLEDQLGTPTPGQVPCEPDPVHTHTCSVQMYSYVPSSAGVSGNSQKEAQQTGMHGLHTEAPLCSVLAPSALLSPALRHRPKQCADVCTHTWGTNPCQHSCMGPRPPGPQGPECQQPDWTRQT